MGLLPLHVWYCLFITLVAVVFATGVDPSLGDATLCEDILRFAFPDLCDMEVVQGNITVKGLRLAFFRYSGRNIENKGLPIVVVHGGPAWGHYYMLPLKQQACRGHEVVFYDQVGSGASDIPAEPRETAPWLFTINYYLDELGALVDFLGWDSFHFIGNSWGTIVGQAYALKHDSRLHGIVLSGPVSDAQLYIKSQWDPNVGTLGSLPLYVQHTIHRLEAQRAYNSPLYAAEDAFLTTQFTSRTVPLADCLLKSLGQLKNAASNEIYVGMQGSSEFTIGGVLANLNLTKDLHRIQNPVLLTHGRYDTMCEPTVDALYTSLPRVWMAMMPHSGHASMIDDPKLMNDVIGEFLESVESGSLQTFDVPTYSKTSLAEMDQPTEAQIFRFASTYGLEFVLTLSLGVVIGIFVRPRLEQHLPARALSVSSLRNDGLARALVE